MLAAVVALTHPVLRAAACGAILAVLHGGAVGELPAALIVVLTRVALIPGVVLFLPTGSLFNRSGVRYGI